MHILQIYNTDLTIIDYNDDDPTMTQISLSYHQQNRGSRSVNILDGTDLNIELESNTQTFDVVVSNYNMPSDLTTYYDTYHELPVSENSIYHITKFEPIITIGNELHVHHMVSYYCPTNTTIGCTTAAYAWAIGGQGLTFPPNVGLEMSKDYLYRVRLQIQHQTIHPLDQLFQTISSCKLIQTLTLTSVDVPSLCTSPHNSD